MSTKVAYGAERVNDTGDVKVNTASASDDKMSDNIVEHNYMSSRQNSDYSFKYGGDENSVTNNEGTLLKNSSAHLDDNRPDTRKEDSLSDVRSDDCASESGFVDTPSEGRSFNTYSRAFNNSQNRETPNEHNEEESEKSDRQHERNLSNDKESELSNTHRSEVRSRYKKDERYRAPSSLYLDIDSFSKNRTDETRFKHKSTEEPENLTESFIRNEPERHLESLDSTVTENRIQDAELSISNTPSLRCDDRFDGESLHLNILFETYHTDTDSDGNIDDSSAEIYNDDWWDNFKVERKKVLTEPFCAQPSNKYPLHDASFETDSYNSVKHPISQREDTQSCVSKDNIQMEHFNEESSYKSHSTESYQNSLNEGTLADRRFKVIQEQKRNEAARLKRRIERFKRNSRGEFTTKYRTSKANKERVFEGRECLKCLKYPRRKSLADYRLRVITENHAKGSLAGSRYKIIHSKTDEDIPIDCTCNDNDTGNNHSNNHDKGPKGSIDDPNLECQSQEESVRWKNGDKDTMSYNVLTKRRLQKQKNKKKMEQRVPDINSTEEITLVYKASTNFVSKALALGVIDYVEEKQEEMFPWRDRNVDKEIRRAKEMVEFYKMVKWTDLYECSDAVLDIFNETPKWPENSKQNKRNHFEESKSSICSII